MDLTQLKMFCAVADSGSIARAAELLHRVPSNLTTRLRQLEEELGADLFIREKQRLRLSPMGHNFLCYAQRILSLSAEAMAMAHSGEPSGNFALGAVESAAASHLPALLAEFNHRYQPVSVSLSGGTSGELIEQVRTGKLAAALADGPATLDELNSCIAYSGQWVLISSHDHSPVASPAEVVGSTLFTFRAGCAGRQQFENWFLAEGVPHGSIVVTSSYHTMLASVASGAGLAMLPLDVLTQLPGHERVRQHVLPPTLRDYHTWLVWRRDAFTPNVEAFKYLIIEQFEGHAR